MLPTAPVIEETGNNIRLDTKFVEGMHVNNEQWPGSVTCILRRGNEKIPFGGSYNPDELEFDLRIIDADTVIDPETILDFDVVLCAGDSVKDFNLAEYSNPNGPKVIYAIEYTLQTRVQIATMDKKRNFLRRAYSVIRILANERLRKRALKKSYGIQANGYPAYEAYNPLNANTMLYLDNRMKPEMFATDGEMADRAAHLESGGPIRLINSGRLEPMKGAQDLIPIAKLLKSAGLDFKLSIFGSGSLKNQISRDISRFDLGDHVSLHDPVDFETELVPFSRTQADIFLSLNRQSDPSCTYLESMGCGLPIAGYRNKMWAELEKNTGAGWGVALGDYNELARKIIEIAKAPGEINEAAENALIFAKQNDFLTEFRKRNDHLLASSSS